MLYFLYGDRQFTKRESVHIKSALIAKRPDAVVLAYDGTAPRAFDFDELVSGQGLFQSRFIVEFDNVFGSGFFVNEKEAVEKIKNSENIFLILEEKLLKKSFELLKKNAEKTSEDKTAVRKEKKDFSAFSLADAVSNRQKKMLWTLFREAVQRGYKIEELHGILFWQMKTIVLAYKTTSAEEAGIKQYPFSKATSAKKFYTEEEAENFLHSLSQAIVEGRGKKGSLEHSVERFILSL